VAPAENAGSDAADLMPWVEKERTALVATLRQADPDGPTLCEGWDVRRLLAHLVLREQEPLANVSDGLSRPTPGQEKNLTRLTDDAQSPEGFGALVDRFSAGPPSWSPMSWAGENLNLIEYVIHHEDIRRAGPTPAEPRALPQAEADSIFRRLMLMARVAYARSPVGVSLTRPGKPTRMVKKGRTPVEITGEPTELALFLSGRHSAAKVDVAGPPEAVAEFQRWLAA
jgi:uncharacterized protein (TIGR03085 family)